MLTWASAEDSYVIILQQGKAIIEEIQRGSSTIYLPRIEDKNGNIIANFGPGFEELETADSFVSANLIELDRVGTDELEFRRSLTSTLDTCASFLNEPNRVFHRRRVESIKGWLTNQRATYDTSDLPQTNWLDYTFDWQQIENQNQVEVPPHGKALIVEDALNTQSSFKFRSTTNYRVHIEDPTGIVLIDPYPSYRDFMTAEARLRKILIELEQPFVDESYLDYLAFTLQLCQRLLPPDTDLMQYMRLQYIETYLGEVLP